MDSSDAGLEDSLDRLTSAIRRNSTLSVEAGGGDEPSPSQGLRLISAFAKIRDGALRNDVIAMIEAVATSQGRSTG